MNASPSKGEEWEPLSVKDRVYSTSDDGDVTPAGTRGRALFGAIVRGDRKRTNPLVILTGPWIAQLDREKKYELGADILKKTLSGPNKGID